MIPHQIGWVSFTYLLPVHEERYWVVRQIKATPVANFRPQNSRNVGTTVGNNTVSSARWSALEAHTDDLK